MVTAKVGEIRSGWGEGEIRGRRQLDVFRMCWGRGGLWFYLKVLIRGIWVWSRSQLFQYQRKDFRGTK